MTSKSAREGLRGYGIALLAVVLALAASYATWPLSRASPWAFFFTAVIATAWFGGQRSSFAATVGAALLGRYFFLRPYRSLSPGIENLVVEFAFVGVSLFISYLAASRRGAKDFERAERKRFQATVSSIGDGVIATDSEGIVTFLNGVAEALTGWKLPEAEGRRLEDVFVIINEATRESTPNPVKKVMETGRIQGLANHTILISRDGTERPIDDSAAPIMDDGRVTGVVLVFHDITEKHRAAKALAESEERYRTLFESMVEGFCVVEMILDADGRPSDYRFLDLNPAFEGQTGLKDARGKTMRKLAPDHDAHWFEIYGKVAATGESVRFINEAKALGRWFDVSAYRIGTSERGKVAILFVDISERMSAAAERERLAAESDRHRRIYHTALSNTPDLVYVFDLEHRFIYANEALLRMWGRSWDEAIGKNCLELGYEPWHAEMHDREIDHVVATGRPIRGDVPFNGTNGRRLYDYIFVPVFGADGAVEAIAGTTRDVTDRIEAEEALRSKSERLNLLVENTKDYALIITDPDGTIIEWQGGAERITGHPAREVIGEKAHLIFTPEDRAAGRPEQEMGKAAESGRAEDKRWHLKNDGSRFFADGVMSALLDEGGKLLGFGKVFKDATGEKQVEEETRRRASQLQKLAGISLRVSAAHDVPSIIGVVTEEARGLIEAHQAVISFSLDQDRDQGFSHASFSDKYDAWRSSGGKPDKFGMHSLVCRINRPMRPTKEELENHKT